MIAIGSPPDWLSGTVVSRLTSESATKTQQTRYIWQASTA